MEYHHTAIGVQLWYYTNTPRVMFICYYNEGFKIMLALIEISQFYESGKEMPCLDHIFVLIIHSSNEWFV